MNKDKKETKIVTSIVTKTVTKRVTKRVTRIVTKILTKTVTKIEVKNSNFDKLNHLLFLILGLKICLKSVSFITKLKTFKVLL